VSWPTTGDDRPDAAQHPAEDILSPATRARLRAAAGGPGVAPVFTTAASPAELVVLGRIGLVPLGVVRGSSVHHLGRPAPATAPSGEVTALTGSLYTARQFALARLGGAAAMLGAVGVVAVGMDHHPRSAGAELIEIVVTGTAVGATTLPGWDGRVASDVLDAPPQGSAPWTTGLGADALSTAVGTGLAPVAMVFGTCVHHLDRRVLPESQWVGREVPAWTQALADAREVALARLQAEAQRSGAGGVIAVDDAEIDHGWGGEAIEYLVTGSAVRRVAAGPPRSNADRPRP
jgi:uncharacterized protein YbjQ (UPF0145 family)